MACKVTQKSASPRKAFIWQRQFAARDRRADGTEGRISVIYQSDPATGECTVAGSERQPVPLQRKIPVDNKVSPRQKRLTVVEFIRAEDGEKERDVFNAAADALQSMGLNPEVSVSASPSSGSTAGAPTATPETHLSSTLQDLGFHKDKAQLFLEAIFENHQKQDIPLDALSSSSSSGSDSNSND